MSDELDAQIAREWPAQWAKAQQPPYASKKRNRLRRGFRDHLGLKNLRAYGHSCGDCRSIGLAPASTGIRGHICERYSDFHGYALTTMDDLCKDWTSRHD